MAAIRLAVAERSRVNELWNMPSRQSKKASMSGDVRGRSAGGRQVRRRGSSHVSLALVRCPVPSYYVQRRLIALLSHSPGEAGPAKRLPLQPRLPTRRSTSPVLLLALFSLPALVTHAMASHSKAGLATQAIHADQYLSGPEVAPAIRSGHPPLPRNLCHRTLIRTCSRSQHLDHLPSPDPRADRGGRRRLLRQELGPGRAFAPYLLEVRTLPLPPPSSLLLTLHAYRETQPITTRAEHVLAAVIGHPTVVYPSGIAAFFAILLHVRPDVIAITDGYHGSHVGIDLYRRTRGEDQVVSSMRSCLCARVGRRLMLLGSADRHQAR